MPSDKETDNVYLNVIFENSSTGAPGSRQSSIPLQYNVTKTLPILDKCSDYYCSIIRFDIPLGEIPIIIVPVIPNQTPPTNPNLTPWVIGINTGSDNHIGGTDFPVSVIYSPNDLDPLFNPPPEQNQPTQIITPYYFCYDFQNIINDINYALQQLSLIHI